MDTLFGQIINTLKNPENGAYLFSLDQKNWVPYAKKIGIRMRDEILSAKRYHLSYDFSKHATLLAFNVEDPFKELIEKVRVPFDSIWLEWPNKARIEAVGLTSNNKTSDFVGVLIKRINKSPSHFIVTIVINIEGDSSKDDYLDWYPVSIEVNLSKPISIEYRKKQMEYFRESLLMLIKERNGPDVNIDDHNENEIIYGFLSVTMIGGKTEHENFNYARGLLDINKHAVFRLTPFYGDMYYKNINNESIEKQTRLDLLKSLGKIISRMSGLCRFVLSALSMLNDKEYIKIQPIKPGASRPDSLTKPKLQPSYDFVTMIAPHSVFVRDKQGNIEAKHDRMRHEVSGTWVNYHKTGKDDCEHVFANLDSTANRKICMLCGRRKSWRRDHERGNAELGFKPRKARIVLDP